MTLTFVSFYLGLMGCKNAELSIDDMAPEDSYEKVTPGPVAMRRLTRVQYDNSIVDLFGPDIVIPTISEPDTIKGGFLSVGASTSSYTARGVESLENASYGIAKQIIENESIRSTILPCTPVDHTDADCATEFVAELGERVWRRPLTQEEINSYSNIVLEAAGVYTDFHKGVEFAIAGLLQSPNFLYRIELGEDDPDNPGQRRFTDTELASRLSFFLWNSIPDQELLEAAKSGSLSTREGLFTQAKRMLDSPKAKDGVANYFNEYLRLYKLKDMTKDPTLFEHYSHQLSEDAATETLKFLENIVFEEESDIRESLTAKSSFVNHRLAAIYDIPYSGTTEEFQYVEHPESRHRPGLLGQVSFLAQHGHSVSTSATLRGSAVRSILLCYEIPPPPVDVDTSIPEASGTTLTLRDRVAEHLENPSCAGCHMLMDPIGLGLENFDSIGRWREKDNGVTIDATGDLDGVHFTNPTELAKLISENERFTWCMTRGLGRYATGREESRDEEAHVEVLNERLIHHEYEIKPLLLEVIMSPLFRNAGSLEE